MLTDTGNAEKDAEQIFNRRQTKTSSQPVFDWFLIAMCFLVPLDVGVRRIQLDWAMIWNSLGFGELADHDRDDGNLAGQETGS